MKITNTIKKISQSVMKKHIPELWAQYIQKNPQDIKRLPESLYEEPLIIEALKNLEKQHFKQFGGELIDGTDNFGNMVRNCPIRHIVWMISEKIEAGMNIGADFRKISEWAIANNIDLFNVGYTDAFVVAEKWNHEEKIKEAVKNYETHDVVYTFKDGSEIVKLSPEDIASEVFLMGDANLETNTDTDLYSLRNSQNMPEATIMVANKRSYHTKPISYMGLDRITGTEKYGMVSASSKSKIKEWLAHMKNNGFQIDPLESEQPSCDKVGDLENVGWYDDYGIMVSYSNIGGGEDDYFENLKEAEEEGHAGSYFSSQYAIKAGDALLDYAIAHNELKYFREGFEQYKSDLNDRFDFWESNVEYEHPLPEELRKKDFMVTTKNPPGQTEFQAPGMEEKPYFDEKAYNEAMKVYEEAELLHERERKDAIEESFFEFSLAINQMLTAAEAELEEKKKQEKAKKNKKANITILPIAKTEYKITKMANSDTEIPSADDLGFYIDTFGLYLKDNPNMDKSLKTTIKNLPPSKQVRKNFSLSECKMLYETIAHLWRKITGKDIVEESKIEKSPETISGSYWLFKHGFLFSGKNHYLIVKHNLSVFAAMLDLNMFTVQEYLSSDPNKLLFYIIKNGAIRMFIDKDKKAFFQMLPETYAEWGKDRVKRYKFDHKIVKVIDTKAPFRGWKSGCAVKLH